MWYKSLLRGWLWCTGVAFVKQSGVLDLLVDDGLLFHCPITANIWSYYLVCLGSLCDSGKDSLVFIVVKFGILFHILLWGLFGENRLVGHLIVSNIL